jgi:hypothetical protein
MKQIAVDISSPIPGACRAGEYAPRLTYAQPRLIAGVEQPTPRTVARIDHNNVLDVAGICHAHRWAEEFGPDANECPVCVIYRDRAFIRGQVTYSQLIER